MNTLRVFVLGRFQALADEGPLPGLEVRKVQELLAYLSLGHSRSYDRERLATLLWPEHDEVRARRYLRKTLWQLQSGLGQYGIQTLDVAQECVCLRETADLWIDAICFERAFKAVWNIPGEQLDAAQAEMLQHVTRLYRGDLLENWYLDWCLIERQRLQHLYLVIVDKLMRYCVSHGEYDSGLQYGHQILHYDRAREHTHQELMILFYLSGDRTGAIRQYQQCVQILAQELGVPPAEQTQHLYERIRAGGPLVGDAIPASLISCQPQAHTPCPLSAQAAALLQEDLLVLQEAVTRLQGHLQQLTAA
jgi:DNA-binding SARP family transcriptional activator